MRVSNLYSKTFKPYLLNGRSSKITIAGCKNLYKANLSATNLYKSDLSKANLYKADLSGA
ncbi:pentapeptide repeat-containing protein [Nostoc cf. edaphicum LEGE 07299]|uniref:Pentapeptide repeat-containing protein n=1 Tax=Nostoc cf. edaphicum LEGE 07299 TaxID=2777974 RepID=A0ABR9U2F6_9NOSO|nr:pentapeptide repeat-containing protein [Nostoc cf. edaphicum LEGE 07299]